MAKAFAAFDLDGTLVRWQLYHAIGDELARRKLINTEAFSRVKGARMNWKTRTGQESFKQYEDQLIKVFDDSLVNLSVNDFMRAAETVFDEYKDQVYTYTRDLIRELKDKGYLLFAISGSPEVIVSKMAEYYGFDDCAATVFEVVDGKFSGNKQVAAFKKPELLKALVKKHSASWQGSLAVGDTESDIDMLSLVENPIALNPSSQLFDHAYRQGWPIVVERKNVIYKLNKAGNSYELQGS